MNKEVKKKICFIAQFPPPIHGLSKAVDTLYNSKLKDKYKFEKIDITNNKLILFNLLRILRSDADLFYFTISQTIGGNLRDLLILKILELRHKKCLVHLHGGYYRKLVDCEMGIIQKKLNYKRISRVVGAIVLGTSLRNIFNKMLDENRIYEVPNCVDNQYIISENEFEKKIERIKHLEIQHVLYLSNFIESKGYRDVLRMAKMEKDWYLAKGRRKFHFDFAGLFFDKREKEYFEKYIKDNSLENYVTYHGVVSGEEKKNLLVNATYFVLLTKYPKEGQPISIIEAMSNGLIILSTEHAGIPDVVKNGINGFLFDKNNLDIATIVYTKISELKCRDYFSIAKKNVEMIKKNYLEYNYISNMGKVFEDTLS